MLGSKAPGATGLPAGGGMQLGHEMEARPPRGGEVEPPYTQRSPARASRKENGVMVLQYGEQKVLAGRDISMEVRTFVLGIDVD